MAFGQGPNSGTGPSAHFVGTRRDGAMAYGISSPLPMPKRVPRRHSLGLRIGRHAHDGAGAAKRSPFPFVLIADRARQTPCQRAVGLKSAFIHAQGQFCMYHMHVL